MATILSVFYSADTGDYYLWLIQQQDMEVWTTDGFEGVAIGDIAGKGICSL